MNERNATLQRSVCVCVCEREREKCYVLEIGCCGYYVVLSVMSGSKNTDCGKKNHFFREC